MPKKPLKIKNPKITFEGKEVKYASKKPTNNKKTPCSESRKMETVVDEILEELENKIENIILELLWIQKQYQDLKLTKKQKYDFDRHYR